MHKCTRLPVLKPKPFELLFQSPQSSERRIRLNSLKAIRIDTLLHETHSNFSTIQNPNHNVISSNIRIIRPRGKQITYASQQDLQPKCKIICERIKQLNTEFKNASKTFKQKLLLGYSEMNTAKDHKNSEKHTIRSYSYRKNMNVIYDRLKELNLKSSLLQPN